MDSFDCSFLGDSTVIQGDKRGEKFKEPRSISMMSRTGEEFYNTFYNAFTSEETQVTPKNATKVISESLNHDNVYGNHLRPPKLMNIEDCHWWC
ncbi:hypothetical protein Hanom_Chr11g01010261 [Helianthus anomalus]